MAQGKNMASLTDLQTDWQNTLKTLSDERAQLQQQRAPLFEQVTKFHAEKPPGLWGKLRHAFQRVTKIFMLNRKIGKLDDQIGDRSEGILRKAHDVYAQVGETALSTMTNGDSFRKNYTTLGDSLKDVADTGTAVKKAISQAKSASTMELIDTFSDNKLISVLSWWETSDASSGIKDAKQSLDRLQKKLEEAPQISADLGDFNFSNNLGLVLDMVGGIGGTFANMSNMMDLNRAADKLKDVQVTLGKIDGELRKSREHILGLAISVGRKFDPAIDQLATDLAAHLAPDTAEGMQRKAPQFKL